MRWNGRPLGSSPETATRKPLRGRVTDPLNFRCRAYPPRRSAARVDRRSVGRRQNGTRPGGMGRSQSLRGEASPEPATESANRRSTDGARSLPTRHREEPAAGGGTFQTPGTGLDTMNSLMLSNWWYSTPAGSDRQLLPRRRDQRDDLQALNGHAEVGALDGRIDWNPELVRFAGELSDSTGDCFVVLPEARCRPRSLRLLSDGTTTPCRLSPPSPNVRGIDLAGARPAGPRDCPDRPCCAAREGQTHAGREKNCEAHGSSLDGAVNAEGTISLPHRLGFARRHCALLRSLRQHEGEPGDRDGAGAVRAGRVRRSREHTWPLPVPDDAPVSTATPMVETASMRTIRLSSPRWGPNRRQRMVWLAAQSRTCTAPPAASRSASALRW